MPRTRHFSQPYSGAIMRPRLIAELVRHVCNYWPAEPKQVLKPAEQASGYSDKALSDMRTKQAYLQSLDQQDESEQPTVMALAEPTDYDKDAYF